MKSKVIYLLLVIFSSCKFPQLPSPETMDLLFLLRLRDQTPDTRITIIYDGKSYESGSVIDFGIKNAYSFNSFPAVLKNTGKLPFTISTDGSPYTLETTSIGTFTIKADETVPTTWPVGYEQKVTLSIIPDAEPKNLWNLKLNISSPTAVTFPFGISLFAKGGTTGKMMFVSAASSISADDGVLSYIVDTTSGTLSGKQQIQVGNGCTPARLASSYGNKFIYFTKTDATPFHLKGVSINSDGTSYTALTNSPFTTLLNISFLKGIPNADQLFYRQTDLHTAQINSTTGDLSNFAGAFGFSCGGSVRFTLSPKGDYLFSLPSVSTTNDTQVFRVDTSGTLTSTYLGGDSDASNRLTLHAKSKTNDYLFSAPHTTTPGVNNLKVTSLLRRKVKSDGTLDSVDKDFSLTTEGAQYLHFEGHPNDKFFYLGGVISGSPDQGVIQIVKHDLENGNLTPVYPSIRPTGALTIDSIRISPDGKILAAATTVQIGSCASFLCVKNIHMYKIGADGGLTELGFTAIPSLGGSNFGIEWGAISN
ncbi:hypothetical protein [Leptospira ilyithenensis]|uniref:Uncharacterized protein n=1 Tax=Leptospira ilyithenensis TaxID=2484901 RepID=A0A4R9LUX0_9LEPT|nr:hypothetical protein [Leptospira ilyithenensis]TGN14594.1 hypothetical protein EHS11_00975 [Leptospira ilyithenensis]